MDKATLESQHPEVFAEVKALGAEEARQAAEQTGRENGVSAERERVVKILGKAGLKGISLQLIQEGSDYEAALEKMLDHRDQVKAEALAALGKEAAPPVGSDPAKTETFTETANQPIEIRAKEKWDKDPKLQQEYFGKFENFLAYKRGLEDGSVKIISKS